MTRSRTRGERRRRETIHEILDHAVAVMDEVGVAGLSMSEVARRVGIRPPSLYKYFPSRLALLSTPSLYSTCIGSIHRFARRCWRPWSGFVPRSNLF